MARDEPFQAAEKKIERARRSGATRLNLNRMKLTAVPESLGQLTQLQTLNLQYNQLTALPESLSRLTYLKSLGLLSNQLEVLPESFAANPERVARFEREARLLATLSHQNIAGIHGLEEQDGLRYLVLELVEGETVKHHLEKAEAEERRGVGC